MKLKLFEEFILEDTNYATLADYLVNVPTIKAKLSPTGTHMIAGTYFSIPGVGSSVNIKLINITTSDIVDGTASAGQGPGNDITKFLFIALGALSAKITDPKITIISNQFPLPPGVTIPGVTTSLDDAQKNKK